MRNKYIVFPLLLSVWTIIFAHAVIPHHHHVEVEVECGDCHSHDANYAEIVEMHDCSHECDDYACYFDVDFLTELSIDAIFLITTENTFLYNLSFVVTERVSSTEVFVTGQFPKTKYLRGPPLIS